MTWPNTLKVLRFEGRAFNQPIHVTPLPRGLKVLELGNAFNQPLRDVVWPDGLEKVAIGTGFHVGDNCGSGVVWPSGLRTICAPEGNIGKLPKHCVRHVLEEEDSEDHWREALCDSADDEEYGYGF